MKKAEKGLFVVLEEDERSKGVESEEQGQKKKETTGNTMQQNRE